MHEPHRRHVRDAVADVAKESEAAREIGLAADRLAVGVPAREQLRAILALERHHHREEALADDAGFRVAGAALVHERFARRQHVWVAQVFLEARSRSAAPGRGRRSGPGPSRSF